MTALRLFRRQLRADRPALLTVAAVVLVSAFLAAALPRQLNRSYDDALRTLVAEAPAAAREVRATSSGMLRASDLDEIEGRIRRTMAPPLRSRLGESTNAATAGLFTVLGLRDGVPYRAVTGPGAPTPTHFLDVRYQSEYADHVRMVAGRAPGPGGYTRTAQGRAHLVEVAFAADAARRMDYRVGQRFLLSPVSLRNPSPLSLAIEVTGLFEPTDPAEDYWQQNGRVLDPAVFLNESGTATLHEGVALMDRAGLRRLVAVPPTTSLRYDWHYPVDIATLDAGSIDALSQALSKISATAFSTGTARSFLGRVPPATVQSGLDVLLRSYLDQQTTATAVMSLVIAGVLGVALIVVALAVQVLPERRQAALRLTGARGASARQVVAVHALEATLLAVPAGTAGWLLSRVVVDARATPLSVAFVAVFAAVTVALACAGGWRELRRARSVSRQDAALTRPSPRRLAAEALVGILAIVGVVLLRWRGLTAPAGETGIDPLLATVPLLVGLAAGLALLRLVPLPLRALLRIARGRRGAVPFLGVARVARSSATAVLPVLVLLLAPTIAVFASVVDSTVSAGQQTSTWQQVGADYRVDSFGFEPAWVEQVAATPGVRALVPAYVEEGADIDAGGGNTAAELLAVEDPRAYADILRGGPYSLPGLTQLDPVGTGGAGGAGGPLPAVVSGRVAGIRSGQTTDLLVSGRQVPVRVVGTANSAPGVEADRAFVVVSLEALRSASGQRLRPTRLLVAGDPGIEEALAEAIRDFAPAATVASRRQLLAELTGAPLVDGMRTAFRVATVAAAGYSVLGVLLALVLTARPRGRALSTMRTLGLTGRQSAAVAALEVLPLVVVATAAGVVLGAVLPRLLGPAVDLRPFTGGLLPPASRLDPVQVSLLTGGLLALVVLAVLLVGALGQRRDLGAVLRADDAAAG